MTTQYDNNDDKNILTTIKQKSFIVLHDTKIDVYMTFILIIFTVAILIFWLYDYSTDYSKTYEFIENI
jgi:hypothetical protein